MTDENQFDYEMERYTTFPFYEVVKLMISESPTGIILDETSFKDRLSKCGRDNSNIEHTDKLMSAINSLEDLNDKISEIENNLYDTMGQEYDLKCIDLMYLEKIYFQIVAMSPAPIVCTPTCEYYLLECLNDYFENIGTKSIQWVLTGNENILNGQSSDGTSRGLQLFNTAAYYGCIETMKFLFKAGVPIDPKAARHNNRSKSFIEKILLIEETEEEAEKGLKETCYSL